MSSNAYAAALRLELKPSRQRRRWRWLTHLAVLATLPMLQSPWLIATVIAGVLMSWHRTRGEPAITLLWHADGRWTLYDTADETEAALGDTPFIQPWLVILPLRLSDRRRVRRIAIFPDSLPAQEFRRFRVRLRNERNRG